MRQLPLPQLPYSWELIQAVTAVTYEEWPYRHTPDAVRAFHRAHSPYGDPGARWHKSFVVRSRHGKPCAIATYGAGHSPDVRARFLQPGADPLCVLVLQRLTHAGGLVRVELDALLTFAHYRLSLDRRYAVVGTLVEPTERLIDGTNRRRHARGFSGAIYARNGFVFCGYGAERAVAGFLVDGAFHHYRQGARTLTKSNVRSHFPDAVAIIPVPGKPTARWAYPLGLTATEQAAHLRLIARVAAEPVMFIQPRLLERLRRSVTHARDAAAWEPHLVPFT